MNVIIFGGTGDLAARKLLPALFRLFKAKKLDGLAKYSNIIGIGSSALSQKKYQETIKKSLQNFLAKEEYDRQNLSEFIKTVSYLQIDFNKPENFKKLAKVSDDNNLFYLAVAPGFYQTIAKNLKSNKLITAQSSIVVEKPIGSDTKSSVAINKSLAAYFKENQIFRIDHYLGKEAVQNLLALRFGNILFEKIWSNIAIDHVQITVAETLGLENRGAYYDHTGAIKDMLQNHLLQILCLVAMEPPTSIDSESLRDEKLKVLRSLRMITDQDVSDSCVIAQYKEGAIDGQAKKAYADELGVSENSTTETFVAIKAFIDNWRWSGVPFFLRTGKRMSQKKSEIVVQFKSVPHNIFHQSEEQKNNQLIIQLQPEESIKLKIMIKEPSASGFKLQELPLDLFFNEYYEDDYLDAYERLLLDAMNGKSSLFMRRDEVEQSWEFIDSLINALNKVNLELDKYNAGNWGPSEADILIANHGAKWNNED